MCDFSGKLIAWLDRELEKDEMTDVQRHLRDCMECRKQLDAYEQVSKTFDAYCDAVMATKVKVHRRLPRWVPVMSAATAIAAIAAALFLVLPRARVEPPVLPAPVNETVKAAPVAIVLETTLASSKVVHRRHVSSQAQSQNANANWLPIRPAIQIAIPAESMFPPGAVPEGVNFTADLSIAADGSAQQIRLRPRLIEFERRATQP